jgi:hypothetical protein
MTRFLWTGESEYCICGHHITDHETSQWPVYLTDPLIVICRGGDKSSGIHNCEYDEFRQYRIAEEEGYDQEAIENQDSEVIQR